MLGSDKHSSLLCRSFSDEGEKKVFMRFPPGWRRQRCSHQRFRRPCLNSNLSKNNFWKNDKKPLKFTTFYKFVATSLKSENSLKNQDNPWQVLTLLGVGNCDKFYFTYKFKVQIYQIFEKDWILIHHSSNKSNLNAD
jgi:hypothetical protein